MRLTLRTLLSYLDDTLEPAQAKAIGNKVAESEQARDLIERIKQVTRKRRLTTPPSGPGGIDANTIAEYLDNDVTSEKAAEVEQICLASEVHLAEVAACHQILTLVLGEPALVPPSAKQRMYGLVKGPESIPFRKPAQSNSKADLDLSSNDIDGDADETLRMGIPSIRDKGIPRRAWLFVGGGILAACLFGLAVWQLIHSIPSDNRDPKDGQPIAQGDSKDQTPKADPPKTDGQTKVKENEKEKPPVLKEKPEEKTPPPKKEEKLPEIKAVEVVPEKGAVPVAIPFAEASKKQAPIGSYVAPSLKEPAVLLQTKLDKAVWTRVQGKGTQVFSGRAFVSLPGSKSTVALDSGVEITLWGNLPEVTLDPNVWESRVLLHAHDLLDADLTHERGRIVLRNKKKGEKEAQVRVRFLNPTQHAEENYFDFVLQPGAAVIIERFSTLERDEPFYEDAKNPLRTGPTATMVVRAYVGSATMRYAGQAPHSLEESANTVVQWQSRQARTVTQVTSPPAPWFKGTPPLKDKNDQLAREKAIEVHNYLAKQMDKDKQVDVAIAEIVQMVQEAAQKETVKGKVISIDTYFLWRHAIRSSAATDDVMSIYEVFAQDNTPMLIRGQCLMTLQHWLALERDHDYVLLDAVKKQVNKKTPSIKIVELFHYISTEDARRPATYQHLIEGLNNDLLPIRTLSHFHLLNLAPSGGAIPYDPAMPRPMREAAVAEWTRLIPPGQLPPQPKAPPKGKVQ